MKKFLIYFFILFILEATVESTRLFFHHSALGFIDTLICLPLSLIDRSYPFYAEGSFYFGLTLTIINIALQTALLLFIESKITYKK